MTEAEPEAPVRRSATGGIRMNGLDYRALVNMLPQVVAMVTAWLQSVEQQVGFPVDPSTLQVRLDTPRVMLANEYGKTRVVSWFVLEKLPPTEDQT